MGSEKKKFTDWEIENEKTPVAKNTDNQNCVWCNGETKPLFHTQRYCPSCEQGQQEHKEKIEQEITDEDLFDDWLTGFTITGFTADYGPKSGLVRDYSFGFRTDYCGWIDLKLYPQTGKLWINHIEQVGKFWSPIFGTSEDPRFNSITESRIIGFIRNVIGKPCYQHNQPRCQACP